MLSTRSELTSLALVNKSGEPNQTIRLNSEPTDTDANNQTNGDDSRDEHLAKMEVIILGVIFVLIVIGNSCVLIALAVKRFKLTRMYYFLLHLCISDLITGCCTVLPQMAWDITYRFNGGNTLCKVVKCLQLLGPYLSSYVLVVTAIDRYQAICFPLTNCKWTSRKSKLMITIAWLVSMACSLPQAFIFSYQEIPGSAGVSDCWGTFPQPWGERLYVTWYAITIFFIPLAVLTYTYVYICREVWTNVHNKRQTQHKPDISLIEVRHNWTNVWSRKSANKSAHQTHIECNNGDNRCVTEPSTSSSSNVVNPRSHSMYRLSRAKIKTVKVTIVVVICYIVCSSPFILVQLWACWYPGARETSFFTGPIVTISMLLSSLNSTVNPWIYLLFNQSLMKALFNFCCCGLRRRNQILRSIRGSYVNSTCETKLESSETAHHSGNNCSQFHRSSVVK